MSTDQRSSAYSFSCSPTSSSIALGEHRLCFALVLGESSAVVRVVVRQPELVRIVDAKALCEAAERHAASPARRVCLDSNHCPNRDSRKAVTKRGIAGSRSLCLRMMRISASSGCCSRARCARMRSRRAAELSFDRKTLICAISGPSATMVQPGSLANSVTLRPVSSLSSRPDAQFEIDFVADDIRGIGCPAGKVDLSGIERMRPHDSEQKCAVRCQNCRCAEAIVHFRSGTVPMAPGRKARIVGFKIFAVEHAIFHRMVMQQQDASVPDRRLVPPQRSEECIDFVAAFDCEVPGLRREGKVQPVDMRYRWRFSHGASASASNSRLGFAISSCAATSWISRAPASAVFKSTPNTLDAARDSASPTFPPRR